MNIESKYCYLKIKCLQSQRVSSKQYHVCTLLKKNHADEAGGEIISAYCVCVKRITPCNCLCSSSSSCFSASVIQNIREFGSKNCFYRPSNSIIHGFRDHFHSLKYSTVIRIRKNLSNSVSIATQAITKREQCVDVSNPLQTVFEHFKLYLLYQIVR